MLNHSLPFSSSPHLLHQTQTQIQIQIQTQTQISSMDRKLWDCESSLYDSFELKSFKRQLDSAIASRCLSMPRLSDPDPNPVPAVQLPVPAAPKRLSYRKAVLKSVQRLVRFVFRSKNSSGVPSFDDHGFYYGGHLGSGSLTTIPEASEKGVDSPEFDPVVRKTVSERFTSSTGVVIAS